jgi:hypothetical protein
VSLLRFSCALPTSVFEAFFQVVSVPTAPVTVPAVTDQLKFQSKSSLEEVPIAKAAAGCLLSPS